MTKAQIDCFMTTLETHSVSRAAERLFISQPAISKNISRLEAEFGVPLLLRREGGMEPTQAGLLLAAFLRRYDGELSALREEIQRLSRSEENRFRLGCPSTWDPECFYSRVERRLALAAPQLQLSVEGCALGDMQQLIREGKLDAALTHDFGYTNSPGILSQPLTESVCGVVYARRFFPRVEGLQSFAETEFLLLEVNMEKALGNMLRGFCLSSGFSPRFRLCDHMNSALFDTACGRGVMIFSDWDQTSHYPSFGFFPLPLRLPVVILSSSEQTSVQRYVREILGTFSPE